MSVALPRLAVVAALFLALGAGAARAEKVDMTPEQLRATATHVVVGKVKAIYTRGERDGGWTVTHHLAEVEVLEVEKGEGLAKGALVYVRYWTRRWTMPVPPPPSTNGHRGIPTAGETLRIYVARNAYDGFGTTEDGGFNAIGANGFERLPAGG